MDDCALSVIVPTRNEGQAVGRLYDRLRNSLDGLAWELVVVDDSTDDTPARLTGLPGVRVLHREGGRGLATAVVEGFRLARGRFVCVLDADGQHPPEIIPELLAAAHGGADLVVASRFAARGGLAALDGQRRLVAGLARVVARAAVPGARATTDPMSGFFLCRRQLIEGRRLRPVGWKVLLEVLAVARPARVVDVPYRFARRADGESKLGWREVWEFALHLQRLVRRTPSWQAVATGLAYALAVRAGLLAVTLATLPMPHNGQFAPPLQPDLAQLWAEWDGVWYRRIAVNGYSWNRTSFAFFPFYPLLMRLVADGLQMSVSAAGVLISGLASAAAFALLYDRVARTHGRRAGERAVRYLALFPTGFFLAAVYTEATYLLLALLALRALEERRWALTALTGAAAALTRSAGVLLAAPAAWILARERSSGALWTTVAAPAALAAFCAYGGWLVGDPLVPLHSQAFWARHLTWPWQTAAMAVHASLVGPNPGENFLDLAVVVAAALVLWAGRRLLRPAERLYAWLALALVVAAPSQLGHTAVLLSATRLVLAAYPLFIVLGCWGRHRGVDLVLSVVFPLLQAAAFVLFTHGYFVA